MAFWELAVLVVVVSLAGAGLMVLRAVLARAAAIAPQPTISPPPTSLAEGLAELQTVRSEWRAYQKNLDAYLEAFEDIETTVERKRRRTAASASRAERAEEEQQPDADPRSALRARARDMGLPV